MLTTLQRWATSTQEAFTASTNKVLAAIEAAKTAAGKAVETVQVTANKAYVASTAVAAKAVESAQTHIVKAYTVCTLLVKVFAAYVKHHVAWLLGYTPKIVQVTTAKAVGVTVAAATAVVKMPLPVATGMLVGTITSAVCTNLCITGLMAVALVIATGTVTTLVVDDYLAEPPLFVEVDVSKLVDSLDKIELPNERAISRLRQQMAPSA